jgi:hypothetical protein
MLVHSFSTSDDWFEDYARFLSLFHLTGGIDKLVTVPERDAPALYFAWVRGNPRFVDRHPELSP